MSRDADNIEKAFSDYCAKVGKFDDKLSAQGGILPLTDKLLDWLPGCFIMIPYIASNVS